MQRAPDPHHRQDRHGLKDDIEDLYELAIETEFEVDAVEETRDEARQHLLVRIARVGLGAVVLVLGLVALVMPGPGLLLIAIGLGLLSRDVPFARRLLHKVRRRLPEDENGNVPVGLIVASSTVTVLAIGASVWWYVLR